MRTLSLITIFLAFSSVIASRGGYFGGLSYQPRPNNPGPPQSSNYQRPPTYYQSPPANSNPGPDEPSIAVDESGEPLNPSQDNCAKVYAYGPFAVLNVQLDVSEILAVVQHILCDYILSPQQFNQLKECFEVAPIVSQILPIGFDTTMAVDDLRLERRRIFCRPLSKNNDTRQEQISAARGLQQLIGFGCDARQVSSSLAKCIMNQDRLFLPCIKPENFPEGNCQVYKSQPICDNLRYRTMHCPHERTMVVPADNYPMGSGMPY